MRDLKEVLEQNKEKYIEELKNLVGIDTHDLGTESMVVWRNRDRSIW